jgi:small neutral amino acid transporter SnatA (MarC family)
VITLISCSSSTRSTRRFGLWLAKLGKRERGTSEAEEPKEDERSLEERRSALAPAATPLMPPRITEETTAVAMVQRGKTSSGAETTAVAALQAEFPPLPFTFTFREMRRS